jgi:hypothetical protein
MPTTTPKATADIATLVDQLADQLGAAIAAADPASWSAAQAEALVASSVRLGNMAGHLGAVGATQVGRTGAHRHRGDRTEAHHLARVSGVGVGAAKTVLATVDRLATLDATRTSLERGELSARQAAAITEAASVDPTAEVRLLRMARARSIGQLEDECARVRAAAAPDDEADRHRRARSERGCWRRTNRDGSAEIRYRSSSDEVAEAWAAINAFRERIFRDLPADAERQPFDHHMADGFLDLARAATARLGAPVATPQLPLDGLAPSRPVPQPAKVVVRIDWGALVRGYPAGGETSEIAGVGPVPVQVVRDMIASGDPFLAAVVTCGNDVVNVAHLGRQATAFQRTGLQWLDPRCHAEGCDRTAGLEIDHRLDWSDTELTLLAWLDWLCRHHHQLKTTKQWRLVEGTGIRAFVPPDDPRYPTRAGPDHR